VLNAPAVRKEVYLETICIGLCAPARHQTAVVMVIKEAPKFLLLLLAQAVLRPALLPMKSSRNVSMNRTPLRPAVDGENTIYLADSANNEIRKGYRGLTLISSGPIFGFHGSKFSFSLTGPANIFLTVEASTDLVRWFPLWTNTSTVSQIFRDPDSQLLHSRFYRAQFR
jgi:hypothetical protein